MFQYHEDGMKKVYTLVLLAVMVVGLGLTGCQRSSGDMWEDSKTASRYMGRGVKSLAGKHGDSRQISSRDQFGLAYNGGEDGRDYIAMEEDPSLMLSTGYRETIPQSRVHPGDPGSNVPGIDGFQEPGSDPELAKVFRNIHFDYDSSSIKGDDNLAIAKNIAAYMKKHPTTYIFVEGHCDERGPQSYNFALGTNRSNTVRNYLVSEGVDPDNIFTISYGKERPIVQGKGEESWRQNRRAQFKVYTR